jgi:hypothetical protein
VIQFVPRGKHFVSVIKTNQLMLFFVIVAASTEIYTEHINTFCGENVEFANVEHLVHEETTGLYKVH